MKIFGSIKELVSAVFRRNSQEITVQPNNSGSYTGAVDFQLPPVLSGNDILVSENATQPLTNKTIDGDSNTLQDMPVTIFKTSVGDADKVLLRDGSGAPTQAKIVNNNVDSAAAIARSKLAGGTASHVIINDGSGNFSSEAQLAKSRGGAGADMTNVTFPSTGTLVTRDATETLLNKTVVSSTGATTGALTLPSGTTAQQPTPTNGMIRYNTDNGAFEGYAAGAWAGIGGGGTTDKISQAGHGFVVGDLLYLNGSTYTKAIASAANTAEVVGMVSRVIDSATFDMTLSGEVSGLTGLTAGEVYFLSPSSAGGYTTTEPTTIGQVSVPVGVASSTTTMYVMPKRGVVVGGTNARTEISLSNNASTNTQLVTAYDAGEMTGWVVITGTTSYRFYVAVQFSKNAAGTDYNVSYQTSGETPPAGFSIQYSANYITVTLPNVAGFSSAKLNYALNAPAVGATFPLAVDASVITAGTVAAARLPEAGASASGIVNQSAQTFAGIKTFSSAPVISDASGIVAATSSVPGVVTTSAQTFAGVKTFSSAPVISDASGIVAATSSVPGVVTTSAQTLAGVKTFNNGIKPGSGQDTLANYIQGTFTPQISCSTPGTLSVTYTNRTGQYTRIGNVLYFAINVEINTISIGTASGAVFISNMPSFTYDASSNKRAYFPGRITGVAFPAGNTYTAFQMVDSSGVIYLSVGGSDAAADIQISAFGNSDIISVSGFCFVS